MEVCRHAGALRKGGTGGTGRNREVQRWKVGRKVAKTDDNVMDIQTVFTAVIVWISCRSCGTSRRRCVRFGNMFVSAEKKLEKDLDRELLKVLSENLYTRLDQ